MGQQSTFHFTPISGMLSALSDTDAISSLILVLYRTSLYLPRPTYLNLASDDIATSKLDTVESSTLASITL